MASIHVEEPIPDEEQVGAGDANNEQVSQYQLDGESLQQMTPPEPSPQGSSVADKAKQFVTDPSKRTILLVLIFALSFGGYVVKTNNDKQALQQQVASLDQPQEQTEDEAQILKEKIGQFIELPADETPTVATVVDAEKVRGQSFFVNAQNDDKVLLFATAGKAILYRPSTNKIIEVAPINLGQEQSQETTLTPEE